MVLGFVKRYIPIRARTFDEFLSLLERGGTTSVEARRHVGYTYGTPLSLLFSAREYSAQFTAKTRSGRKIVFRENYGLKVVADDPTSEDIERTFTELKVFTTMVDRLRRIEEKIPQIERSVVYPPFGKLNPITYRAFMEDSRDYGLTPFPLSA